MLGDDFLKLENSLRKSIMQKIRENLRFYFLGALVVVTCFIWYAVLREDRGKILTIAVLDIGQGDAIFVEAPNGNQMLIDGGPPKVVLSALRKMMPFYDRSIDILMVTNPDKDHMAGFIDVLGRYSIGKVVEPGTKSPTATYVELERTIEAHSVPADHLARQKTRSWFPNSFSGQRYFRSRDQ